MLRNVFAGLILAVAVTAPVFPQSAQDQIVDRITAGEQNFLSRMAEAQPFLEAYIQELNQDTFLPVRDHYMLMRLALAKNAAADVLTASKGFQRPSFFRGDKVSFNPSGWARMVFLDLQSFDRTAYNFEYERREFLGEVRCLVFRVAPVKDKDVGRFMGDIWVDDRDFRIVRFNGTFTGGKDSRMFFHFDSWRVNVEPGFWVPAFVYVEEGNTLNTRKSDLTFKAQVRLWGYAASRTNKMDELSQVLIEAETPVKDSGGKDVSPVEGQRSWERQAEQNVIDKLQESGLMAPPGEVDKVLNTVVNNLIVTNNFNLDVKCRVVLTMPMETFSIGQTIAISRGLLDVLPDEASLAMVLSKELAHIALGHRTPTVFAFSDQTMFADQVILEKLRIKRSPAEETAAAAKALEILEKSPYNAKLSNAGLFLRAVASKMPVLPNLVSSTLGNQLASRENMEALAALQAKAPPLEENKVDQIAALPLGSRVKLNVWTNEISLTNLEQLALNSAREKMPFEVAPSMLRLTRIETTSAPPVIEGTSR
jgi:hypothetical protein